MPLDSIQAHLQNLLIKDIRVFIREGPMYILEEKRLKKGYLYLFTDVLVVAELNEVTEEKKFEHMVALQSADVKEIPESQYPVFVVTKDSKKYNIVTNTAEERKSWVADIAVQINEVNAPKAKGGRKSDQKLVLARTVTPAKTVSKDQIPTVSNPSLLSSPSDLALNTAPNSNNKGGKLVLESESFMRALQRQHSGRTPEDFLEQLSTKIKLSKFGGPMSFKLRGPSDEEDLMDVEKYVNTACIKSISTFPFLTAKHMRMNDPIADQYGLCAWSNRLVVALGDGCANLKGQQAAFRAVDTFLAEMTDVRPLTDLKVILKHASTQTDATGRWWRIADDSCQSPREYFTRQEAGMGCGNNVIVDGHAGGSRSVIRHRRPQMGVCVCFGRRCEGIQV